MRKGLNRRLIVPFILSLGLALLCGWGTIHFIDNLFYLGIVGGMAFVLVNGVHGGNEAQKIIGGFFYISVNTLVFCWLLNLGATAIRRRFSQKTP